MSCCVCCGSNYLFEDTNKCPQCTIETLPLDSSTWSSEEDSLYERCNKAIDELF